MFLDFYQMRQQPFGVTPDPRFLYLGQSHREALASLFCAIEADRGFVALIAHPGLGKTTLTFQLLEKLQRTSRTVFLFQTQCSSRELFHYVLNDLGVDASGMDMVSMHNKLNEILYRERLAGRRFVLAIDEAQNLDPSVLETIRLLSNFETSRNKLLQILLIGQPQLARKLASPDQVQLQQRISVFARLEPFGSEETARYIAHRLQVAGYGGGPLFTPGALQIIKDRSQGIPRNINRLCFSALSLGCAMGRKRIDTEIMREVVADLEVESLNTPVAMQGDQLTDIRRIRGLATTIVETGRLYPHYFAAAVLLIALLYASGIGRNVPEFGYREQTAQRAMVSMAHDEHLSQTDGSADSLLGVPDATGDGAPRDDAQAFRFLLKSAQQGNVQAQSALATYFGSAEVHRATTSQHTPGRLPVESWDKIAANSSNKFESSTRP